MIYCVKWSITRDNPLTYTYTLPYIPTLAGKTSASNPNSSVSSRLFQKESRHFEFFYDELIKTLI